MRILSAAPNLRLCKGLGSFAKIYSGVYNMSTWTFRICANDVDATENLKDAFPQFRKVDEQLDMLRNEFELRVSEGFVERDSDGRINSHVKFSGVTKNSLSGMKILGIDNIVFSTKDKNLSIDPTVPTVFESNKEFSIEKGTMVPPLFGNSIPVTVNIFGDIFITARMHKVDDTIIGEYTSLATYSTEVPGLGLMRLELDLIGKFSLKLVA